jgi:hypothetical protein
MPDGISEALKSVDDSSSLFVEAIDTFLEVIENYKK